MKNTVEWPENGLKSLKSIFELTSSPFNPEFFRAESIPKKLTQNPKSTCRWAAFFYLGSEFFLSDDSHNWLSQMNGPMYLRFLLNAEHTTALSGLSTKHWVLYTFLASSFTLSSQPCLIEKCLIIVLRNISRKMRVNELRHTTFSWCRSNIWCRSPQIVAKVTDVPKLLVPNIDCPRKMVPGAYRK